jgi:plastocyanin
MDAGTIPKFSRRWRCFAIGLAALLLLTVFVAACGEDPTPTPPAAVVLSVPQQQEEADAPTLDASPPQSVPSSSAGAFGFSHYVFEDVGGEVITTLVEGPVDEQVRAPVSYQQLKAKYENGEALDGLSISRQELGELVGQLDTVRDATAKYRDISVALAEGYLQTTEDVPNMGAHFIHPIRALDGLFDPAKPEILMYTGDDELGWRLVGTSFVLPREQVGDQHPQAFVGPLDNWHVHYELCTGTSFRSRSATQAECRKDGGVWVPAYGWMIHAWVWVDNPLGVFTMWNPSIPPVADPDRIRDAVSVAGDTTVNIENFGFGNATISAGDTLAWSNADGVSHTVTAGSGGRSDGGFDSGLVGPGASFQLTFDEPGSFAYTCTLHSFMSGVVVVTP